MSTPKLLGSLKELCPYCSKKSLIEMTELDGSWAFNYCHWIECTNCKKTGMPEIEATENEHSPEALLKFKRYAHDK